MIYEFFRVTGHDTVLDYSDLHGNSSEDIDAQLSKIEDDGEKEYRSEAAVAEL